MNNQKEYTRMNIVNFVASQILNSIDNETLVSAVDLETYNMSFPMGVCEMHDPDSIILGCIRNIKCEFHYSVDQQSEIENIVTSTASLIIPKELLN